MMAEGQTRSESAHKDFLISYTRTDQAWAEWIAATLEEAGYHTIIAAWDLRPGSHRVLAMDQATKQAQRTLLVLSAAFLEAVDTFGEWTVAFGRDPKGDVSELRTPAQRREVWYCPPYYLALYYALKISIVKAFKRWRNRSRRWARETDCPIVVRNRKNWRTSSKVRQKRAAEVKLPKPRMG